MSRTDGVDWEGTCDRYLNRVWAGFGRAFWSGVVIQATYLETYTMNQEVALSRYDVVTMRSSN